MFESDNRLVKLSEQKYFDPIVKENNLNTLEKNKLERNYF